MKFSLDARLRLPFRIQHVRREFDQLSLEYDPGSYLTSPIERTNTDISTHS
jgi:hypothetical protein